MEENVRDRDSGLMSAAVVATTPPTSQHAPQYTPPRGLTLLGAPGVATGTIRVAIADGQALVRAGFRVLLERSPGITVVGEAATGEQAVAMAHRTRPNVVLIDVHLPGLEHVRAMQDILAQPGVAVMLLAGSESDDRVLPAIRAGAGAVLLKDTNPGELVRAVRALAQGAKLLSIDVARQLTTDRDTGHRCSVVPLRRRLPRQHRTR
jgi:DNA-binding NarL/FixJ family response regulator